MALRLPPGRAGRLWLLERIETATRARDLLDDKRRLLLGLAATAAAEADAAEDEWRARAAEAERWLWLSAAADGERARELACAHVEGEARVELGWRSAMGVRYPSSVGVTLPAAPGPELVPGGHALERALAAHRAAVEAGARAAAARAASNRLAVELASTARRLRAIESRWLPRHEQALRELELALDEAERAEAARTRWIARRQARTSP